jgi:hypothetical protein
VSLKAANSSEFDDEDDVIKRISVTSNPSQAKKFLIIVEIFTVKNDWKECSISKFWVGNYILV